MIYKLDEISKKDVQEVGGKASNLGELIKLGFNVPKGFVCTSKENIEDIYNMYNKLKLDKVAVRSLYVKMEYKIHMLVNLKHFLI